VTASAAGHLRAALAGNPALQDPDATVSIVIPVYNALEHVVACLHSVAKHTDVPFRLVIINDGSPDPDIAPFVAELDGATASVAAVPRNFFTAGGLTDAGVAALFLLPLREKVARSAG